MATVAQAINREQAEDRIKRFDVHQIVQHAGLMVSFILLVLTGLPLKFSNLGISQWWVGIWGGLEVTRATHNPEIIFRIILTSVIAFGVIVASVAIVRFSLNRWRE